MLEPPASAVLVEDFVNTLDVEEGTDLIATPAGLAHWLAEHGLLAAGGTGAGGTDSGGTDSGGAAAGGSGGGDAGRGAGGAGVAAEVVGGVHAGFLALRAGVREELGRHVGDEPDPALLAAADQVLAGCPVLATARGTLLPSPELPPQQRALTLLALAWSDLVTSGDAARLKRCAEHTCGWVFWDTSKNRSRRWCSMRVCGNRNKSRSYASRRRAGV